MRDFHATLNLTFQAKDEEEALEIAKICRDAITSSNLGAVPFKIDVDIDDVEEN